jgi:hypothetical protein
MTSRIDRQLDAARKRREIAEELYRERAYRNAYESLGSGERHARRAPPIETQSEEAILTPYRRTQSIANCRELHRESPHVRALLWQLSLNVFGTHPKVMWHSGDEPFDQAAGAWFNREWAPRCDGRGSRHLADLNRLAFASVLREGDALQFFDAAGLIDPGRLFWFEADQLVSLTADTWKEQRRRIADSVGHDEAASGELVQVEGVIHTQWGRPVAYAVTPAHGMMSAPYKPGSRDNRVTILPATTASLVMSPWRLNQLRGVGDVQTIAADATDLHEFRSALLRRAKVQSYLALKVHKRDAAQVGATRGDVNEGGSTPAITDSALATPQNYRNFEKLSSGAIEYLQPDDDVEAMQLSGDAVDAEELHTWLTVASGWALGMPRLYSTGKADASYSASRAEGNLAEMCFRHYQKWSERYLLDWQAKQAVGWAMDTGKLARVPDIGQPSWSGWPEMAALDPRAESEAIKTDLSIGRIDYSTLLGPDWREKLDALGEQIKAGRDAGFFSAAFQPNTKGA